MRSIRSRLIFFKGQRDRFDHGRLMRANRSRRSLKKIEEPRLAGAIWSFGIDRGESQKHIKKTFFWAITCFLRAICSFSKTDESDLIFLNFFKDWRERSILLIFWSLIFWSVQSFSKINERDTITVDLF